MIGEIPATLVMWDAKTSHQKAQVKLPQRRLRAGMVPPVIGSRRVNAASSTTRLEFKNQGPIRVRSGRVIPRKPIIRSSPTNLTPITKSTS